MIENFQSNSWITIN